MTDQLDETRKALKAFARGGYELFPLKPATKIPRDDGWQRNQYSLAGAIASWVKAGGNVGVRLRPVDLVIDDDPRSHPGDDPLARLCFDTGVDLTDAPTVITGRGDGGRHFYWRKPADLNIVGKLKAYKGVDIRSAGMFVVAPGSIHPETKGTYRIDPDAPPISDVRAAPDALLELIARPDNLIRVGGQGAGIMTPEQMAMLLEALDVEKYSKGEYDKWFAICAACHDATEGTGLPEFLAWCAGDGVYNDEVSQAQVERHWDSCKAGRRGGATYRTLLAAVADAGRPDLVASFQSEDERQAMIAALNEEEPFTEVIEEPDDRTVIPGDEVEDWS